VSGVIGLQEVIATVFVLPEHGDAEGASLVSPRVL